jgi:hypothetical protein
MDEDLKKITQDLAEIKQMVKGIKGHFVRQEIYQWLIVFSFVVPFIVIVILIWPSIKGLSGQYQEIMSNGIEAMTGADIDSVK